MSHVSGHTSGLMSNPYKQAAESMQSVGIKSLSGATTSTQQGQQAQQKQRKSGFKPIRDYNTGPVGASGSGKWNAGHDDDEESNAWDKLRDESKDKNRILNEVVEKYNEPWLGASSEWGNFEDDLPITQAAKWGSNFFLRALSAPFEATTAKFIGDPAANIYEGLQEAGYVDQTGTKKTISDKGMFGKLPISGMEYEQPSPVEFGKGVKTTAEIGAVVYSIPNLIKLGGGAVVGGYKKVQNFFKPKEPIKGTQIDDLVNSSVGAQYKPLKHIKKLDAGEVPPEIEGYTGFVTYVGKDGKEIIGATKRVVEDGQTGFTTSMPRIKYNPNNKKNYLEGTGEELNEVVIYYKNQPSILTDNLGFQPVNYGANTVDNSGVILKGHLDEIYQTNQSFIEGVPTIRSFQQMQINLDNVIISDYANKSSKIRKMLDAEGITPQSNPSVFRLVHKDGKQVWMPKVMYHGTSRIFTDGLKGDVVKISSVEDSKFIGVTMNLEDTLGYIQSTETLGAGEIVPRIYMSIPKFKKTFDVQRNADELDFAVNHIAEQRFNHFTGKKILNFDDFDTPDMVYQSDAPGQLQFMNQEGLIYFKDVNNNWKNLNKNDWSDRVRFELTRREYGDARDGTDISNWQQMEVEMRVFNPEGNITPNHILQDRGYDSFVTIETTKFSGSPVQNIMAFDPEKTLVPITTVIDDLNPQKHSLFLSQQLQKPNVGYGGEWGTVGQYMHKYTSSPSLRPDVKPEETGPKLILELLGDAGDTINQPYTPFDNDEIEAENFAKFA